MSEQQACSTAEFARAAQVWALATPRQRSLARWLWRENPLEDPTTLYRKGDLLEKLAAAEARDAAQLAALEKLIPLNLRPEDLAIPRKLQPIAPLSPLLIPGRWSRRPSRRNSRSSSAARRVIGPDALLAPGSPRPLVHPANGQRSAQLLRSARSNMGRRGRSRQTPAPRQANHPRAQVVRGAASPSRRSAVRARPHPSARALEIKSYPDPATRCIAVHMNKNPPTRVRIR